MKRIGGWVLLAVVWLAVSIRPAGATVCCGLYLCEKIEGVTVVDDYLAQCGGASCGGSCLPGFNHKDESGCYWNGGSTCGGGSEPTPTPSWNPGSGGGSVCSTPRVDCPPGTVRGTTLTASACLSDVCTPGSAQVQGACCATHTIPRECGDWYSCPTPSNPDKLCRDCTEPESFCIGKTMETYECVPVCDAAAATDETFSLYPLTRP